MPDQADLAVVDSDESPQRQNTVRFSVDEGQNSKQTGESHEDEGGEALERARRRTDSHYFREDEAKKQAFLEQAKEWANKPEDEGGETFERARKRTDSHYFREDEAKKEALLEQAKEWESKPENEDTHRRPRIQSAATKRRLARTDTQAYRDDEEGKRKLMEKIAKLEAGEEVSDDDDSDDDHPVLQGRSFISAAGKYRDVELDDTPQMSPPSTQDAPMLKKTDTQLFRTDEERHKAFLERTNLIDAGKEENIASIARNTAEMRLPSSSSRNNRKPRRTDTYMHRQDEAGRKAMLARMDAELSTSLVATSVPALEQSGHTETSTTNPKADAVTQPHNETKVDADVVLFGQRRPVGQKSSCMMWLYKEWLCCEEEIMREILSLEHREGEIEAWTRQHARQCDMWAEEACASH